MEDPILGTDDVTPTTNDQWKFAGAVWWSYIWRSGLITLAYGLAMAGLFVALGKTPAAGGLIGEWANIIVNAIVVSIIQIWCIKISLKKHGVFA